MARPGFPSDVAAAICESVYEPDLDNWTPVPPQPYRAPQALPQDAPGSEAGTCAIELRSLGASAELAAQEDVLDRVRRERLRQRRLREGAPTSS